MKHSKDMKEVICQICEKRYYKRILTKHAEFHKTICYDCYKKEQA